MYIVRHSVSVLLVVVLVVVLLIVSGSFSGIPGYKL